MQPTRVRYSIILLALLINLCSYTDRACIAVAGPRMREEFGFSPSQMGLVFSIFSLSYFIGQAPWGALADRLGSRWLVSGAICCWSVFTAMTGAASGYLSMLGIRFTFGALEAALSPAVASAFTRWVPVSERATAFGAFLSGGRIGAAVTPPIAALLMVRYGWRVMFAVFGVFGVVWGAVWFFWYRDSPASHWAVNEAERKLIEAGTRMETPQPVVEERPRWREILSSSRLWFLLAAVFAATFQWQFYITWFPTYLMEKRGMSLSESAAYSGLPFLFGVAAAWIGGLSADALARRYHPRVGRTILGVVSLVLAGSLMLAGLWYPEARGAAVLMALAAGCNDLYIGAAWASAVDIGGRSGGAVSGLMNSASNCAGFVAPVLMGWVLQTTKEWNPVLFAGVAANLIGAVLWLRVNPKPA